MYSLEGIKKGLVQPRYILQEVDRLFYQRLKTWPYNRNGLDVFSADWDNLLVLDACRYDLFERVADLPGETRAVQSRGSATREFLRGNVDGRTFLDTVYVSASPMLYRYRDEIDVRFHDVVNVWKDRGWNDQYRTVLPETVAEAALDAAGKYPNKRLFVHFIQPHYPFIGPTGREHFDLDRLDFEWADAATGALDVSDNVIRRAYEENLTAALPSVRRLLKELGGLTVVTSDHGQMIGERLSPIPIREYGHPPGLYADELVKVPWHAFENGSRRDIITEEPQTASGKDDNEEKQEQVRARLRDLGYTT